jgi:hypothetical protein
MNGHLGRKSPRRSAEDWRSPVLVPIAVWRKESDGKDMKGYAQAKEVNFHGGLLQFLDEEVLPDAGAEMKLTNMVSGEAARTRITGVRVSKGGTVLGVAVELLVPSETFWGVTFRLRKATAELHSPSVTRQGARSPRHSAVRCNYQ